MYKLYQFALPFITKAEKSIFNITKVDIFEDKYLSLDLSCILHNTVEGSCVDVSVGREETVILPRD